MSTQNVVEKPRPRIEQERAQRRRREDLGAGRLRKLAINGTLDPNYTYRWINDEPGRVYSLTVNDDWDVVTHEMLGERGAGDKGAGTNVERIVDRATGKRAVLVRKMKDWYRSDKAKEQAEIEETERAIKAGASKDPSSLQASEPGKAYVPAGGISIQRG